MNEPTPWTKSLRRLLGFDRRCDHQRLDGRCELIWNQTIIVASAVLGISMLLPTGSTVRQLIVLTYLLVVPGMALAVWLRDTDLSLFTADNVMLVIPLSFFAAVGGSLPMIYTGAWSPGALAAFTALGAAVSARVRIRRHIPYPRTELAP